MNAIQKISITEVAQSAPEKYILSINLRIDGFSFLIQDQEKNAVHMEYYEWLNVRDWSKTKANIALLLKEHTLLKLIYPKVNVFVQSSDNFLIPEKVFSETHIAKLFEQYTGLQNHSTYSTSIPNIEGKPYLVFGIETELAHILLTKWNVRWYHYSKFFIANCINYCSQGQDVFIKFQSNSFEILATKAKKLEAHNYFEFLNAEEFIFNVLSFIKQIDFDVNDLNIHIEGKILKTSVLYQLIEKFIPNVHFQENEVAENEALFTELIQAANYANN